jgi:hypothetical protein
MAQTASVRIEKRWGNCSGPAFSQAIALRHGREERIPSSSLQAFPDLRLDS